MFECNKVVVYDTHLFIVQVTTQTSDVTNVGRYKGRTVQTPDLKTSDWYKRRTETNVRLVQTSDLQYIYKEKRRTLVEFKKKTIAVRNKLKITHLL